MSELIAAFHFLRPLWLLALPLLLALAWTYHRQRDPRQLLGSLIAPHLLPHLLVAAQQHRRRLQPAPLLLLLVVLSVLALAGPSWQKQPTPFASEDATLMIVLRVAESMQSGDIKPSRMERARNKIHDLLALRQGARSGLIAYAGSAHRVTPPTADARLLEQMAAALQPDVMPRDGDALSDALQLASTEIARSGGNGSILLITDSVSPAALKGLDTQTGSKALPPLQILAPVASTATAAQTGVRSAAQQFDARLQIISADDSDVSTIKQHILSATSAQLADGEQWRDDGWLLLPFIAVGLLAWAVKGWRGEWA